MKRRGAPTRMCRKPVVGISVARQDVRNQDESL